MRLVGSSVIEYLLALYMKQFFGHCSTLLALSFTVFTPSVAAAEIDPFNGYSRQLKDSSALISSKADEMIQLGIARANEAGKGCDQQALYDELRLNFNRVNIGPFSNYIYRSEDIERVVTPVFDSVYQDWGWRDALIPGLFARYLRDPSGTVINVAGVRVGTDKFEHFSGSGFRYFELHYLMGRPLRESLHFGFRAEAGFLGAVSTGVLSFGDLAANFGGMRFWNHLLATGPDVLGEEVGPYVVCEEDAWKQVKKVDITVYVDTTWDESNNCSLFRTDKMLKDVLTILEFRSEQDGIEYRCPFSSTAIEAVKEKYGENAKYLINSDGHNSLDKVKLTLP